MAGGMCASGHPLVGLVLAGGLSSRMGRNKLRIKIREPDGPDLLARTVELLARYCCRVLVACGAGPALPGYDCIQDCMHGIGPIAGLQAILSVTDRAVLALACDLPFMDDATVQKLAHEHARRPDTAIMTTFRQAETGFIEALTAIYEPACLPFFDAAIAAGDFRINSAIPQALRQDIVYTAAEARPFFNINSPADLEAARRTTTEQAGFHPDIP